jgi:hypothetical protein
MMYAGEEERMLDRLVSVQTVAQPQGWMRVSVEVRSEEVVDAVVRARGAIAAHGHRDGTSGRDRGQRGRGARGRPRRRSRS